MSELGQQLREARLQKGMSLDDVQEITKIRKRYLEAIEAGDYKVLPGSFYVRAFIKTYAEAVGLKPDELLEGHKQDVPKPEPESTMEPVMQKRASRTASERSFSWLPTVLMWTFPILIIAVIYLYAIKTNDAGPDQNSPTPTPQTQNPGQDPGTPGGSPGGAGTGPGESAEEPGAETGGEPSEEDKPEEPAQIAVTEDRKEGRITVFKVSAPEGTPVKVEIKASGKSWVEVYRGYNSKGEKLYFGNTSEGETLSYDMDSQGMYLKSGYSPATEIKVGGQVITDGKTSSRFFLEPGTAGANSAEDSGE